MSEVELPTNGMKLDVKKGKRFDYFNISLIQMPT